MTLLAVGIVVHVVGIDYGGITSDTILPIIVTGIGVGFAEETMFRGVILRALRTDHRREFTVIWVSSVWFGFFHLTNIINGTPALTVLQQCVVASLTGVVLYSFRRWRGLLVAGMAAHGLWDVSVFFPASELGVLFVLAFQVVIVISAIVVIFALRRERVTVTSQGVVDLGDRRAAA